MQDYLPALLESLKATMAPVVTLVVGMLALLWDVGPGAMARRRWLPWICGIGLVFAAIIGLLMQETAFVDFDVQPYTYFGGGVVADSFGGYACAVLAVAALLAIGMSGRYLEEKQLKNGEFYGLLLFSTAGGMLMAQSFDLVNVFIGLEILSVALYILAGFARRERRSEEAAVKYFLLGAFASGFLLFGMALVYGSVGMAVKANALDVTFTSYTNLYVIGRALKETMGTVAPLVHSPVFVTGVSLIVVGLGFKAAIVPFHSYAPDVYEGSPTPVTAFMSAGAKIGAFTAFVRLFHVLLNADGSEPFRAVLWVLALLTMVVGNVMAIRQTNIKRMLAYSSIAHAGYILVGVLAAGYSQVQDDAAQAVIYYLFVYSFMNLGAFAVVVWLGRDGSEYQNISDYAGLARKNPVAAGTMLVFLLSLAGIPPTAGFVGKLYLFMAAVQAGQWTLAAVGLVVSAIGLFYYLNIIVQMYLKEPQHDFSGARGGGARSTALIAAGATVLFGVLPTLLIPPVPNQSGSAPVSGGAPAPSGMQPSRAPDGAGGQMSGPSSDGMTPMLAPPGVGQPAPRRQLP